ncbi:ABC transporter substrate-binding protein [Paenibacillus sp. 481]|uniref:ABC transporter substrate-binding protein n=1 Tax=Paenibacillus sp. 481 TaxID=2835869 RepID=UPI001E2B2BA7|nr:iron-siderophore ABC transporter substrate-binding protein [Paenibacillus sp. 481]UHA73581.1 iron-siderophore ABC transporter substrate-binding protein [Paenibacillus sp. 481]
MLKMSRLLILIFCFSLALVGCSSGGAKQGTTEGQAKPQEAQGDVRKLNHLKGEIEIKGTPQRVVVLEWSSLEDVLALGVKPVGAADIDGYKKWVNIKPDMLEGVTDVGSRVEPNLEIIQSLKPDLIIGVDRIEPFYDKLSDIAPTILFNKTTEQDPDAYAMMERNLKLAADALNKQVEGEKVLKEVNDAIAALAGKVKEAGKADTEFVLVQAFTMKNVPTMRYLSDNSMSAKVFNKLGLKNAFQPTKYVQTMEEGGVEALLPLKKANFFYIVQDDDHIFKNQLKENPVWKNLDFVKENRTYAMGGDTWLFGGPLSAQLIAERAVGAFVK